MPIDWVALIGVTGAMLVLIIPVLGLTARFASCAMPFAFTNDEAPGVHDCLAAARAVHVRDPLAGVRDATVVSEGGRDRSGCQSSNVHAGRRGAHFNHTLGPKLRHFRQLQPRI